MKAYSRAAICLTILALFVANLSAHAQLSVNFSVDKTEGCSPLTVSFTNKTTGASATAIYKWDLGNGNTSALANPSGLFTEEKSYPVTLTVQDGNQTASKTVTITVHPKPIVDFSAIQSKGCIPFNTTFTPTIQAGTGTIASCYWDFGDGATQQSSVGIGHTYTQPQKASVILTATNNYGCYTSVSKKDFITVLPALKAGFTAPDMVCRETDPVQFTDTSSGPGILSYVWNFSDGGSATVQNPVHVFKTKGVHSATLTVTSTESCVASKQLSNIDVATFKTDFEVPPLICTGSNIFLKNISTPSNSNLMWVVNNSQFYNYYYNLEYNFYTPGTYTIKLVNNFGACKDSVEKQLSVKQAPRSQGFITNIKDICGIPTDVEFKDTTANAVKWEWNFGTYPYNVESYVQNPVKTYTQKSSYSVYLNVTNADGCQKTISKYLELYGPEVNIGYFNPDKEFVNARTCTNNRVGFNTYSPTGEQIVSYKWDFGDGGTSTEEKPIHVYTTAAIYNVTLTYTTKKGCTAVATLKNFIIAPESKITDISATATEVCGNAPITFTANVSDTRNTWPYYYWDFGDGTYGGAQYSATMKKQYFQDGTYTVRLIWTGGNGNCPDTMVKTSFIKVLPPVPKITRWENTCAGFRDTVTFMQSSIKAESWTWDFGDGTSKYLTTDEPAVKHIYANTGEYKVVLTTTNGQCSVRDSIMAYVVKKQHPVLTSNVKEVCKEAPPLLTVSNVEPNPYGGIKVYWLQQALYGDDSYAGGWMTTYFATNYTGTFIGVPTPGKKDMKVVIARFTGSYANDYCFDTTNTIPLTVKGAVAGYKIINNNICFNDPAVFQDTSVSYGGTIQKWEWDFGDGQTATKTQPGPVSHTYSAPGRYWVSLKVADNSGCQAVTTSGYIGPVMVSGAKAAFSASATTVALASKVNFTNNTNTSYTNSVVYKWQIDGVDFSTDYNTSYTFNKAGSYTITLIATDPVSGCTSTATQAITVKNFNAAFSMSTAAITPNSCPPVLVRFTNNSQNYTNIKWDFGDGTVIENVNNPSHFYAKAGKFYITLQVDGANGLSGTFYDSVTILQAEAVLESSALDVCKGTNITLSAKATNTGSYVWDFGDGNVISTTDTFAKHQYVTPGVYSPALLIRQTVTGCTGSVPLPDKITVRPNPVVTFTPAQPVVCKGSSVSLQASGGVQYEWSPATDLSNAAIANPVASPVQTSSYKVKVTDNIGCMNTGDITVTVVQPVKVSVTGDTEICQGESVQLKAAGAEVYKWINDVSGLSGTTIANPVTTPASTVTYTVTGSDTHSCFTDQADITIQVSPLPSVYAGADVQAYPGDPVPLQTTASADAVNWKWTPSADLSCANCAAPVCTPTTDNTYAVTVKNQYGCAASDTVVVKLLCNESRIGIPNGFTPNGDGKNDVFMIKGVSIVKHLLIYNRYGQKVFERSNFRASDRSLCWNGTLNGFAAEAGTYVYFLEVDCPGGGYAKKGTVTLVR